MKKSGEADSESSNPDEYVSKFSQSRLSPAEKAKLARIWMENQGYTRDDISGRVTANLLGQAQNGTRRGTTRRRMEEHDSRRAEHRVDTRTTSLIFDLYRKDMYGRYLHRRWNRGTVRKPAFPPFSTSAANTKSAKNARPGGKARNDHRLYELFRARSAARRPKIAKAQTLVAAFLKAPA
jgi:hypothetical protein